jgi:hypothetical protein
MSESKPQGTVRWFGPSWDAPINDLTLEVATPDGSLCHVCERVIVLGDQGVSIPAVMTGQVMQRFAYHLTCWISEIVPVTLLAEVRNPLIRGHGEGCGGECC